MGTPSTLTYRAGRLMRATAQINCRACGLLLVRGRRKWCNRACARKGSTRVRIHFIPGSRKCQGCGCDLTKHQRKWCAGPCRNLAYAIATSAARRATPRPARSCAYCEATLTGRRRRFCDAHCARRHEYRERRIYTNHNAGHECSWCRAPLPPYPLDGMGPTRTYCDATCRTKSLRGTARRKKRARLHGAPELESIRAIEVFEAAGWRCQACGCDTSRELMGKNRTNSPELDHILALSLGGAHVRSNVQLLCRSCNVEKAKAESIEAKHRRAGRGGLPPLENPSTDTGGGLFLAAPHNSDQGV